MTITFNPILLEDPKFRELISNKEILSIYRSLHNATVENITFLPNNTVRVIYSFSNYVEATHSKQIITQTPPYKDILQVQQDRDLITLVYKGI